MNMSSVLHRSTGVPTMPDSVPAGPRTGGRAAPPSGSWPPGVRALVAALLIATVVSTIAAVVGHGRNDDAEQTALRNRIAELTDARADALDQVRALDAELVSLEAQLAEAMAGGDELSDRVAELQTDIAAIAQQRSEALDQVDELTVTVSDQAADLGDVRARLALAIQERDELAERFPFGFDVSLVGVDMAGDYRVKVTDVVGTTPKFTELTILRTEEGWLTVRAPGLADGGFTMVDGVLQMVAGSATAAGTCDGVARQATVVMTIVPHGYEVDASGAQPTGFDAVITTIAPATGSCAAVAATASAVLTPAG